MTPIAGSACCASRLISPSYPEEILTPYMGLIQARGARNVPQTSRHATWPLTPCGLYTGRCFLARIDDAQTSSHSLKRPLRMWIGCHVFLGDKVPLTSDRMSTRKPPYPSALNGGYQYVHITKRRPRVRYKFALNIWGLVSVTYSRLRSSRR